ncbi:MAG: hypothetical protein NC102_07585 [Clostridium sp.]|nr:hypothetical protein [Clostridium sp.]
MASEAPTAPEPEEPAEQADIIEAKKAARHGAKIFINNAHLNMDRKIRANLHKKNESDKRKIAAAFWRRAGADSEKIRTFALKIIIR